MRLFICAFYLLPALLFAQVPEEKIKAVYLYNFAKNTSWPPSLHEIRLGVYGSEKVYSELMQNIHGRAVGSATVKVLKISQIAEAKNLHMFYLGKDKDAEFSAVKSAAGIDGAVLITENDLATQGSHISFVRDGTKLKFKINQQEVKAAGISFSQNLLSLAIVI